MKQETESQTKLKLPHGLYISSTFKCVPSIENIRERPQCSSKRQGIYITFKLALEHQVMPAWALIA